MSQITQPRLRIFAGPNGSGKSTLFEAFSKKYATGHFINADIIENELTTKGYIDLNDYGLTLTENHLEKFLATEIAKGLIEKSKISKHNIDFEIKENIIADTKKESHSYEGALISLFLRENLIHNRLDFCFETVMSHPSKIDEIRKSKKSGYKTYLYFVCTDDPEVNISRVENRVFKGGHDVEHSKILSRYKRTLENLMPAIEYSDKVYLFDNSGENLTLIAKVENGTRLELKVDPNNLPNWFINNVLSFYT